MRYTVKEMAELSGTTIKTLHHYHKIGLLLPCETSEAGYRLYGTKELERLQQILFYRELDFPLEKIKQLLDGEPDRLSILSSQKELLLARKRRLERVIQTLEESMEHTASGEEMDAASLFIGFSTEQEWLEALAEQNQHLKESYGVDLFANGPIDPQKMNAQAAEAKRFTEGMAASLRTGVRMDAPSVRKMIRDHLDFLNQSGHATTAEDFKAQARFFLDDDFHRSMLESQQTGLAYYLLAAAESYAAQS
jgi:DNA-binding transcriptional MerR regulator